MEYKTMNQSTTDPAGQTAKPARRSTLDRAVLASVIAMAAMNILVLAQQMQTSPLLSAAGKLAGASLA